MRAIINNELIIKKMNFKNHLYALFPLMVFTLVVAIGIYLFYQKYGVPEKTIMILIVILYSLFALQSFFLHLRYIPTRLSLYLTRKTVLISTNFILTIYLSQR